MLESQYQAELIKRLNIRFPGCEILKNDTSYRQGIPDLTIFHNDRWAWLEVKKSANAAHQPNQDYYVQRGQSMSFAAFICPQNEEEVLDELQRALEPRGSTRILKRV